MENLSEKDLRNKRIVDMHNSGSTIKEIMTATGISKSGIYKILDAVVKVGDIAPKTPIVEVKMVGTEERFMSFVGYERTNVNEYSHKDTGEVIRVAFVKAKNPNEFGYFVKLAPANVEEVKSGEIEKKSNPADEVIKEAEANLAIGKGVKL